jgi:hypothetical protein
VLRRVLFEFHPENEHDSSSHTKSVTQDEDLMGFYDVDIPRHDSD